MNTKNTVFLLVIAVVVLGAIYYQKQKKQETFKAAAIPETTIPSVTSGTLERITIDPPDQEAISLTRSEDKWYTNLERKYEADENAVTAAIRALEKPIEATVVSSNPDSYDEYQVSETSATQVRFFESGQSKPALDILIGKAGPSAFSTYVRLADSEQVLNAQAGLGMTFKREEGWRNKQIFSFSGGNAVRLEETGTSATFTVVKNEEDKWMFEGALSGEADSAKINSLANMLASLRADDFVNPTDTQTLADFGLEPPRQTVALTYEDKTTSPSQSKSATLLIGTESNTRGNWYAKRADKNDIFTIGSHVANALTPDPNGFKVAKPAEEEAAVTTGTQQMTTMEDLASTAAQESEKTTGTAAAL